jgi:DNA-binding transcriptional LysR family regulator
MRTIARHGIVCGPNRRQIILSQRLATDFCQELCQVLKGTPLCGRITVMHETLNEDDFWRRLDWNDVRIFLAVAESGSLNAASRLLGTSQPTISRRVEVLEGRLGARLFSRNSRGAQLTDEGVVMRDLAAGMARLGGAILRDVGGRDRDDAGRVCLAAPDGIASYLLVPMLAEFQRANPQISVVLDCGLWPGSLASGDTDLSIEFHENAPADMVSTPLATLHYALHASRDYLSTYGVPRTYSELVDHRIIRHTAYREQRSTWNRKTEALSELAGAHVVTNSSAAMFHAVRTGVGVGNLPTYVNTLAPELVMLDFEPLSKPTLWLRHHPGTVRQERVRRVKDWLLRVFDSTSRPWFRSEFIHPREFPRAETPPAEPTRPYAPARRRSA